MSNTAKGLIITSLGALIMSFEALFIKLTSLHPLTFSLYLGICMFISCSLILSRKNKDIITNSFKHGFKYALIGATLMATSNIFFISAVKNTLAANVVLILAAAPLFASFFSYAFYKIKPTKNIFVSSSFIFIGLIIIFSEQIGLGNMKGNIYALVCAMLFSLLFVVLSKHTSINRIFLIALAGFILAVESFVLTNDVSIDMNNFLIVALMGFLITPISRVLIGNGTKFLNASEVSLLMIIETVTAPIWVWFILKEVPSSNTFLGGGLIILTLILNALYTIKKNS